LMGFRWRADGCAQVLCGPAASESPEEETAGGGAGYGDLSGRAAVAWQGPEFRRMMAVFFESQAPVAPTERQMPCITIGENRRRTYWQF